MRLLPILFFIVSSNLDNLVIGLSYGLKEIRIGPAANLLIGLMTLAGTVLSMGLGKTLLLVLPARLAGMLGSIVILLMGLYLLARYLLRLRWGGDEADWPQEHPEKFDRDRSKNIDLGEAVALGAALAVNNVGLGVGVSAMGLHIAAASLGSCLCSLLCLYAGNRAGRGRLSGALGRYAEPLSGLLVLLMGLWGLLV